MTPYLLLALSYLLGATPTSYWVGRTLYGVDLRQVGSGNLGATNTFRVLGWRAALPVMVVDVAKGWLPAWAFQQIDGSPVWAWAVAYGAAAIIGHVFSVWVRFKGGKGIATSAGVYLALAPLFVLLALAVWLVAVFTTRIVSLGSILAALTVAVAAFLVPHQGGVVLEGFTIALAAFVIWAHRANIGRLLRGEELAFRRSASEAAPGKPAAAEIGSPDGGERRGEAST